MQRYGAMTRVEPPPPPSPSPSSSSHWKTNQIFARQIKKKKIEKRPRETKDDRVSALW